MNKGDWYKSTILQQNIVQLLVALTALFGITAEIDWEETTRAIFAGIAALISVGTMASRLWKANPPLTEKAADKAVEFQAKPQE